MRKAFPFLAASAALIYLACGSSSTKTVDAHSGTGTDAGTGTGTDTPDAPPTGLTGLGQKCTTPADCPASAPECITLKQGGTMYCTPHCLDNGSGTTNGSGQFVGSGTGALTPLPDDTKCSAQYSGSAADALCEVILSTTPADNPLKPNTKYTAISWGCLIDCTTDACPTGTTCDATQKICYPN